MSVEINIDISDRPSTPIRLQFDRATTFYVTAYLFRAAALWPK